jgi:hypothetical protein
MNRRWPVFAGLLGLALTRTSVAGTGAFAASPAQDPSPIWSTAGTSTTGCPTREGGHMRSRRYAAAVALVLVAVGLAGCTRKYPGSGTTLCGHHVDTGAASILFQPLDPTIPAPPGPAPVASSLPPMPSVAYISGKDYIRTSPTCATGAIVAVTPRDAAFLDVTVPADDGRITGISLFHVTAPVTVAAWVNGTYQGSLILRPPATTTASPS